MYRRRSESLSRRCLSLLLHRRRLSNPFSSQSGRQSQSVGRCAPAAAAADARHRMAAFLTPGRDGGTFSAIQADQKSCTESWSH